MEYKEFYKWVHLKLGINLEGYKQGQLTRRIDNLMKRLEIKSLKEFTVVMERDITYRNKFLDFITINVTEFFRNPELYKNLEKSINTNFPNKKEKLKVWSAACSLGCEPYSVAMILKENGYSNFKIVGTDIDKNILQAAKEGIYTKNELKSIPLMYKKYFEEKNGQFYLSEDIKKYVTFKKSDLILDKYDNNFHIVLCRNVVIYFNNEIKKSIYEKITDSLNKGGLFFVGATESIYNFKEFGYEKESTFIYKKI